MFWISVVGLGLVILSCTLILKGNLEATVGLSLLIAMGLRVCWIVTLPIVFHRINISWDISQENLLILDDQRTFSPYANSCGDPLNAMNIDLANDYMF